MSLQAERAYKITANDKEVFHRDGYWISPKLIDDDQIERLRKAHERIWSGDYDGDGLPMNPFRLPDNPHALRKLDNGLKGGTRYRAGIQRHDNIRLLGPRPVDGQAFDNDYFPVLFQR